MIFVCPISAFDMHLTDRWVECIKSKGEMPSHTLFFLPTKSAEGKAYEAAGKLNGFAGNVVVSVLPMDNGSGWPTSCNWQWFQATMLMEPLGQPWMWVEQDALPVRGGWADIIAGGYTSAGAPFYGQIVQTPWKDEASGREVPSLEGKSDTMMCGVGVYPAGLRKRFDLLANPEYYKPGADGLLADLSKGGSSVEIPWDLFLRHAMRKMGTAHTDLIADRWNTINYRLEDGVLTCDPNPLGHDGNPAMVRRHGQIDPHAVIIHGCKDDSLANLILKGLDTKTLIPIPKPLAIVQSEASGASTELASVKAEMAELKEMLRQSLASKNVPEPRTETAPPCISPIQDGGSSEEKESGATSKADPASSPESGNPSIPDRAFIIIGASAKKLRIGALAGIMKVPVNRLTPILQADPRFEIVPKLGWISLAQAPANV